MEVRSSISWNTTAKITICLHKHQIIYLHFDGGLTVSFINYVKETLKSKEEVFKSIVHYCQIRENGRIEFLERT